MGVSALPESGPPEVSALEAAGVVEGDLLPRPHLHPRPGRHEPLRRLVLHHFDFVETDNISINECIDA